MQGSRGLKLVNGVPVGYVVQGEQVVEDDKTNVDPNGHRTGNSKMDEKADGSLPR